MRYLRLFWLSLKIKAAANNKFLLLVRKICWKFRFLLWEMLLSRCFFNPEIFVNMKQRKLGPLACQLMPVVISHLTDALLWRNMIESMCLLLSNLLFNRLPTTSYFMGLPCCMPTTTSKTIMLHSYGIFGFFKWKSYFLSSKYVSIEVLAKYLCGFIVNFILGIDHYNILGSNFIKYLSYNLRMTRIDKNQF